MEFRRPTLSELPIEEQYRALPVITEDLLVPNITSHLWRKLDREIVPYAFEQALQDPDWVMTAPFRTDPFIREAAIHDMRRTVGSVADRIKQALHYDTAIAKAIALRMIEIAHNLHPFFYWGSQEFIPQTIDARITTSLSDGLDRVTDHLKDGQRHHPSLIQIPPSTLIRQFQEQNLYGEFPHGITSALEIMRVWVQNCTAPFAFYRPPEELSDQQYEYYLGHLSSKAARMPIPFPCVTSAE